MTRKNQKVAELKAVQKLIERLRVSDAKIENTEDPNSSPDMIVKIPSALIGVEVTMYDGGPNKSDSLKEQLYFLLCRRLDALMRSSPVMKGLDVDLFSAHESSLTKRRVDHVAKLIFDNILHHVHNFSERPTFLRIPNLLKYVRVVSVKRAGYAADIHLPVHSDLHSAWVSVPQESLGKIISKKAKSSRIMSHKGQKIDEHWLLITDGIGFRGSLNTPKIEEFFGFDDLYDEVKTSPFSRCYILCDKSAVFEITKGGVVQRALYFDL